MSSQTTYQWIPGPVGEMLRNGGLASSARVPLNGTLVATTGHVGVDVKTGTFVLDSIDSEFNAIFDCLDAVLKNAGVPEGMAAAHKVVAYFTDAAYEAPMLAIFKERYPGHMPTWTSLVVKGLMNPGVHAEVQAEAVTA